MRIEFTVTEDDLRLGHRRSPMRCAVANAATVKLPSCLTVRIHSFTAEFWKAIPQSNHLPRRWRVGEIPLPEDLRKYVEAVDAGTAKPGATFALEIPDVFAR